MRNIEPGVSESCVDDMITRLKQGHYVVSTEQYSDNKWGISFSNKGSLTLVSNEISVVVADIVSFSTMTPPQQVIACAYINIFAEQAENELRKHDWQEPRTRKGLGDGLMYQFGHTTSPNSLIDAIKFSAYLASKVAKFNSLPKTNSVLNRIELSIGISYNHAFLTKIFKNNDVLTKAANIASRLATTRDIPVNGILVCENTFHKLKQNSNLFFYEPNGTKPISGDFSSILLGKKIDTNNFLYLADTPLVSIKHDEQIQAFRVKGRLDEVDF